GGIAGLGGPGTLPDFSLYGSRRVIVSGGQWPTEYRLTPQALDRLIAEGRRAGLETPRTIDDPHVSDAFYTLITFLPGKRPATTKIIKGDGRGGTAAAFAARLDPRTWPGSDLDAGARPYIATRVAVLAMDSPAEGAAQEWPFGVLGSGRRVGTRTCTVLSGKAATAEARRLAGRH